MCIGNWSVYLFRFKVYLANLLEIGVKKQNTTMILLNVPCRRQSGMLDSPSPDKENTPPTLVAQTKKVARLNNCSTL
jgi:hypothetical protein